MQTSTLGHNVSKSDSSPWFGHRNSIVPDVTAHWMSEVLALLGVEAEPWANACAIRHTRVRGGSSFFSEGSTAQALYVVRRGYFKSLRFAEDGYEQVLGFAVPGDVLGFEGLASNSQPLSVTALEDASVLVLPLGELDEWRERSPALDRGLQRAFSRQLMQAREHASIVAAVASEVRLARFIVWMSSRLAASGEPSRHFLLHMSRRDIASLLAIAHETVSRGLGLLAERGYLKVDNRAIEITDWPGLIACTRYTRRDADAPHHRTGAASTAQGRPPMSPRAGAPS